MIQEIRCPHCQTMFGNFINHNWIHQLSNKKSISHAVVAINGVMIEEMNSMTHGIFCFNCNREFYINENLTTNILE